MKILSTLFLLIIPFLVEAQDHSDCISAIKICFPQTIVIPSPNSYGSIIENLDQPCGLVELGSIWFSFSFHNSGMFYFTITPSEFLTDIDFAVFKANSEGCQSNDLVRCMASGENAGPPIDSNCLGPTGLSLFSTDVIEHPGCFTSDDNFLAALNVNSEETYYLMVIDFTQNIDTTYLTIEFMSTAELDCSTGVLNETTSEKNDLQLFPNPASDKVEIIMSHRTEGKLSIQVFDPYSRMCMENIFYTGDQLSINTLDLTPGIYFARVLNHNDVMGVIPFVHQ